MDGDYFLTIAELAVALAGFGSLAALIGRRTGSESAAVDAGRLRAMLERSLTTMVVAVLPIALSNFALPDRVVWGVPSVLFATAAPYVHIAPIRRMRRDPTYRPGLAYALSGWGTLVAILGLLLAGLLGFVARAPALGLALLIDLSVAASLFLRVASSLMSAYEPAPPAPE